jgi:DNA-binding response OmpR family regulator
MPKLIMIVDDDALMRRSLAFNLERSGYHAITSASAEDAFITAQREHPDLILLDINLPGMDGMDALKEFQKNLSVPIIFLTARRRELDEVLGLELGADDYITKPFELDILLARIKVVLRRSQRSVSINPKNSILTIGDLIIDPTAHTLTKVGHPIEVSPREFDLLYTLALEPGRVYTLDELLGAVWGAEYVGEPQAVYVHVRWLREKLEEYPNKPARIITVRGVGYKLVPTGG